MATDPAESEPYIFFKIHFSEFEMKIIRIYRMIFEMIFVPEGKISRMWVGGQK